MNADQQTRLEIMKALEKVFPDRLLEDLIDVARYVEAGGVERAREESQDGAAKYPEEAADISEPRTWTALEDVPDDVLAVTDADGSRAMRVVSGDCQVWAYTFGIYTGFKVDSSAGPFTEVLF